MKDLGVPTTNVGAVEGQAFGTKTESDFPDYCSTWCAGNPDGVTCAGFEMKLWN